MQIMEPNDPHSTSSNCEASLLMKGSDIIFVNHYTYYRMSCLQEAAAELQHQLGNLLCTRLLKRNLTIQCDG